MKVRTARKKQVAFLYQWSPAAAQDLIARGIELNVAATLVPEETGYIAFNREYPNDRWYLTADYVDHFYEFVGELDWDEPPVADQDDDEATEH